MVGCESGGVLGRFRDFKGGGRSFRVTMLLGSNTPQPHHDLACDPAVANRLPLGWVNPGICMAAQGGLYDKISIDDASKDGLEHSSSASNSHRPSPQDLVSHGSCV